MNFNNIPDIPTKDSILSKVSEYDIFRFYIHNFTDVDKPFTSELRVDKHPAVRIYINQSNELRYKDFASGEHYDCWNYVMRKFGCNYFEAVNIIYNDFGLGKIKLDFEPKILFSNDEFKAKISVPREKSNITIVSQGWTIQDYEYWNQFGIPLSLLDEYNVFSCKYVYLIKGTKRLTFEYNKKNPIYGYRFTRDGNYSYKIYFPLHTDKKYKWLFSGGASEDIEGYDCLPLTGDKLILTKSLKDCMCYNLLGLPAISLQGEGNKLPQELVDKLLKRFNQIIINYDNDSRGITETDKLIKQYNFNHFYIDKSKDLSDYIKEFGLEQAKIMIYDKIKSF